MNKTLLKCCLIIIAVFLISSLTMFYITDLKEPVFLEHYYELMISDEQYIELSYVTNNYDDMRVCHVTFPQLEGTGIFVNDCEMASYSGGTDNRYKMQTVRLRIMCESSDFFDDIILDNAELLLSNGKTISGSIGKIVLFSSKRDESVKFVETLMSSSSNSGISFSDAHFLDDVRINSLPFVLKAETDGILKLFVNNLDDMPDLPADSLKMASGERFNNMPMASFSSDSRMIDENSIPFAFQKGEYVLMVSEFTINHNDTRKYNRYNIHRRIYLENAQGETDYHLLYNMNYQPYFEGMDFYEFLKHKGVK